MQQQRGCHVFVVGVLLRVFNTEWYLHWQGRADWCQVAACPCGDALVVCAC
jgi:hypothetical protein